LFHNYWNNKKLINQKQLPTSITSVVFGKVAGENQPQDKMHVINDWSRGREKWGDDQDDLQEHLRFSQRHCDPGM
jgi:hypothetical protein